MSADPILPPAESTPPQPSKKGWPWALLLLILLVAAGAYFFWPRPRATADAASAPKAGKRGGGGEATPVVGAKVRRGDIGVYDAAPGTVTPIYTVTVRSRVDGQLLSVQYKEGDIVQQGQVLVEIDPRPYQAALTQAQGALERDQALLQNARTDLARYQTLVSQKAVPEQTVATQKATVEQYEGIVKNDQGLVDAAQVNLEYCRITAPITGLVGLRLVDPGNIVHASDTTGMLVITQMDPISVIFPLSQDLLGPVRDRMRAGQHLEVDAWDSHMAGKIAQGTLSTVDNEIDPTTGTVRLRAAFDNPQSALFPSEFVNARLLVQDKRGVVLVNQAAIQRNSNVTFVFLVQPDSTVITRNVAVGTVEGEDAQITSGLKPGDVVVLTGVDKLEDGTKVTVQLPGQSSSKP